MSELKAMMAGLDAVERCLRTPVPPDEEDWIQEWNTERDYTAQNVVALTVRLRQAAARTFAAEDSLKMQALLYDAERLMQAAAVKHA